MKNGYENAKIALFLLLVLSFLVLLFIACYEPEIPAIKRRLTIKVDGDGEVDFLNKGVIPSGSTHEVSQGKDIAIEAIPSENGGVFLSWELDPPDSDAEIGDTEEEVTTIRLNQDNVTLIAHFGIREFTLTLTTSLPGSGTFTKEPDKPTYHYGDEVKITAIAEPWSVFGSWSGGASGTTNPLTVTITGDTSITANYTWNEYILTLTASPTGSGTFTKSLDKFAYHYGDEVIITATGESCRVFGSWSGGASGTTNPLKVTITGNTSITANFNLRQYTITATARPGGSISDPGSVLINCGATRDYLIQTFSSYTLVDVIVNGIRLGPVNTHTFNGVDRNQSITAIFEPDGGFNVNYALADGSDPGCASEVFVGPKKAKYEESINVLVTDSLCTFYGWNAIPGYNASISNKYSTSISVTIWGDVTIYAHMEE